MAAPSSRALRAGLGLPFLLAFPLGSAIAQADGLRFRDLPHTDMAFSPAEFNTREAWEERRQWLQTQVLFAAGLWPAPRRGPLNARVFDMVVKNGYTVEKVVFQSTPGLFVTGNLYRPLNRGGKRPAVACPHGHWEGGRVHHEDRGSVPARCVTLARLGAIAFAWDMVGYNESEIEHRDARLSTRENALWGIGQFQLQTWNSIRALDFLQSLDDVDGERIGVTGASGGGTQTFILSAVDPRVKVAAPVNMVSSIMQGGCVCENAPALRIDANNMDIAAMFAPKPLLLISASGDWTRNTPQVEFPFIRSIYDLYDSEDRVANAHFDAPHNYNRQSREAMYRFFAEHLLQLPDADRIREGHLEVPSPEELLIDVQSLPADMLETEALIERLKDAARARVEEHRPSDAQKLRELETLFRTGISHAVGSGFPDPGEIDLDLRGDSGTYRRRGRSVRWTSLPGADPDHVILVVHPAGLGARSELSRLLSGTRRRVVLIEPFGTGAARVPEAQAARGSSRFFTTFNRTDAAEMVYDIVTALAAVLRDPNVRRVELVGFEGVGPACLVARALVPDRLARAVQLRSAIDLTGLELQDEAAYIAQLELPNILRLGGLRAAAAVACNGPTLLHGVSFDPDWVASAATLRGVALQVRRERADPQTIIDWLDR